jgi:hypothetical protein
MTLSERRYIVVLGIRQIEAKLLALSGEYDGVKSYEERMAEIRNLQNNLFWANRALVLIDEESEAA